MEWDDELSMADRNRIRRNERTGDLAVGLALTSLVFNLGPALVAPFGIAAGIFAVIVGRWAIFLRRGMAAAWVGGGSALLLILALVGAFDEVGPAWP